MCAERGFDYSVGIGVSVIERRCNCRQEPSHRALWVELQRSEPEGQPEASQNSELQLRSSPLDKQPLDCDLQLRVENITTTILFRHVP